MIGEAERKELVGVLTSHFLTAATRSETDDEVISAAREYARSLSRREAAEIVAEARKAAAERRRRTPVARGRR